MTSYQDIKASGSVIFKLFIRFPFLDVEPLFFESCVRGHLAALDGEMLSRKGALRVRISFSDHIVDLVVTHLIGEILDNAKEMDVNECHRQGQTKELLRFIESSCFGSDVVVLGGDFNFDQTHESYNLVTGANFRDTGVIGEVEMRAASNIGDPTIHRSQ